MRTLQLTLATLAVAATSALIGAGTAAPAGAATTEAVQASTTTTHERGIVLECTGRIAGQRAWTSLYENSAYGNVIQVVLGDDGTGGSREVARDFLKDGKVRGSVKVDGTRAVVRGTAHRVGQRQVVHEEYDDAGQHITVDGFHRPLATDLRLRYGQERTPLTCDNAFVYSLTVVREDVTG